MKKLFLLFFVLVNFSLYAEKLQIITPNSYYLQLNIKEVYNKLLVLEETKELIRLTNLMLNNNTFKQYLYFQEIGNVKVSTADLIQYLNYFLAGWPKYTNTYFDNNSNTAGILKILQDSINDDSNFVSIPEKIIDDMKKSIKDNGFFKIAKNIEFALKHKNLKKTDELKYILKEFDKLVLSYSNSISKINIPLLKEKYNEKIKDELIRKYRIYAKLPLSKTIKILSTLIHQNYESIFDKGD